MTDHTEDLPPESAAENCIRRPGARRRARSAEDAAEPGDSSPVRMPVADALPEGWGA